MADDIDIEEHNILENPRIQTILPDIKTEVFDPEYQDENEFDENCDQDYEQMEVDCPSDSNSATENQYIIPDITDHQSTSSGNMLILGTRPSQHYSEESEDDFEDLYDEKLSIDPIVALKDCRPMLQSNVCFCKECKTLFATENALLAHNNIAHSLLVASYVSEVSHNVAIKSTAKFNEPIGNKKKCSHCQKLFTDEDLIKHLYDIIDLTTMKMKNPIANTNIQKKPVNKNFANRTPDSNRMTNFGNSSIRKSTILEEAYNNIPSHSNFNTKGFATNINHAIGSPSPSGNNLSNNQTKSASSHLYYRCPTCTLYFKFRKGLVRHNIIRHKIFNVGEVKLVPFNTSCLLCANDTFKYKSAIKYNNHIRKCHRAIVRRTVIPNKMPKFIPNTDQKETLLKSKNFKNTFVAKKGAHYIKSKNTDITKKGPACPYCGLKFNDWHQRKSHILKSHSTKDLSDELVTNTIFMCPKCERSCSPTAWLASMHARFCQGKMNQRTLRKSCVECGLSFKPSHLKLHSIQHSVVKEIKTMVFFGENCAQFLCKCPRCEIYFGYEKSLYKHYSKCKGNTKYVECDECDVRINVRDEVSHMKRHKILKLVFIKLDFFSIKDSGIQKADVAEEDNKIALKRNMPDDDDLEHMNNKKIKFGENAVITFENPNVSRKKRFSCYYCPKCQCIFPRTVLCRKRHLKKCGTQEDTICSICGIKYIISSGKKWHNSCHRKFGNFKLRDISYYSSTTGKPVIPTLPKYDKCDTCLISFSKFSALRDHQCGDTAFMYCKVCSNNFTIEDYNLHLPFHFIGIQSKNNDNATKSNNIEKVLHKDDDITQILKTYESLDSIWNIIYLCEICNTVSVTYDETVEHCQKHFNNMESFGVTIMHCDICDLNFDGSSFTRHEKLHIDNPDVTNASFKILSYNYESLLTSNWINIFADLTKDQIAQISQGSIYSHTRRIKMKVVKDGTPGLTMYKCLQCHCFIHPQSVENHADNLNNCKTITKKHACSKCKIEFLSRQSLEQHEALHSKSNLTNLLRLVTFNDVKDREFNKTLQNNVCVSKKSKSNNSMMTYFECQSCSTFLRYENNIKHHICHSSRSKPLICPVCRISLKNRGPVSINHLKSHGNVQFVPFEPIKKKTSILKQLLSNPNNEMVVDDCSDDNSEVTNKIIYYKCKGCEQYLHLKKKIRVHSCFIRERKRECRLCDTMISNRGAACATHLSSHHKGQVKVILFNPVTKINPSLIYKKINLLPNSGEDVNNAGRTIYQCQKCLQTVWKMENRSKHNCLSRSMSKKCPVCQTWIKTRGAPCINHLKSHKGKINIKSFNPKTIPCETMESTQVRDGSDISDQCNIDDNTSLENESVESDMQQKLIKPKTGILKKIYQCPCGIHFDSCYQAYEHLKKCQTEKTSKSKCAKCNLVFLTKYIASHTFTNHMIGNPTYKIKPIGRYKFKAKKEPMETDETELETEKTKFVKTRASNAVQNENTETTQVINNTETAQSERKDNSIDPSDKNAKQTVYYCEICDFYLFTIPAVKTHLYRKHVYDSFNTVSCELCGMKWHTRNIKTHSDLHHNNPTLQIKDLNIIKFKNDITIKRPAVDTSVNDVLENTVLENGEKQDNILIAVSINQTGNNNLETLSETSITKSSNSPNTSNTFDEVSSCSKNDDTNSDTNASIDSLETSKLLPVPESSLKATPFRVYKCADCNVYYTSQQNCYKHAAKHIPLDARDYIECKFCELQFTVTALKTHMKIHHGNQEFHLDKLLVEEYFPNIKIGKIVKIDIYKFSVQSKIISTTTVDVSNENTPKDNESMSIDRASDIGPDSIHISCNDIIPAKDTVSSLAKDNQNSEGTNNAETDTILTQGSTVTKEIKENINVLTTNTALKNKEVTITSIDNSTVTNTTVEKQDLNPNLSEKSNKTESVSENCKTSVIDTKTNDDVTVISESEDIKTGNPDEINSHVKQENIVDLTMDIDDDVEVKKELEEDNCQISNQEGISATNLIRTDENKEKVELKCDICDSAFKSPTALKLHKNLDHSEEPFSGCPICGSNFYTSILNEYHLKIKKGKFICCKCTKSFDISSLEKHNNVCEKV